MQVLSSQNSRYFYSKSMSDMIYTAYGIVITCKNCNITVNIVYF